MLSEKRLIESAHEFGSGLFEPNLLDALETYYMNGSQDEVFGDVNEGLHYYRVNRWIVQTDSQGFREVITYDSEEEAKDDFLQIAEGIV